MDLVAKGNTDIGWLATFFISADRAMFRYDQVPRVDLREETEFRHNFCLTDLTDGNGFWW